MSAGIFSQFRLTFKESVCLPFAVEEDFEHLFIPLMEDQDGAITMNNVNTMVNKDIMC